jgi:hypothetical protein
MSAFEGQTVSSQFGLASAPIAPQAVQTMRGPHDAPDFSAPVTAPL